MLVYLVRHGDAADLSANGPRTDADRPLTDDGRIRFREAAECYAGLMIEPDRVVSSPLVRARETAEILCEELEFGGALEESEQLVYSAPPTRAVTLLQAELLAHSDSIVLVGHEPHLGCLLGLLLSGSDRAPMPLSKGMCAAVEIREPQSMIGKLRFALSQKIARKLGR
ncbi:MAG: histidine phosphatase family protein [Planctomycetes bacterium]|nr:histidine phosphatase family protein [Planctomycetota bacterium]